MQQPVIVDAVRTPIGRRKGSLAAVHPVDLSAHVLNSLVARNGLEPEAIEDVIWGCVNQISDQAANVGRWAVLAAGWPETIPGTTVDRFDSVVRHLSVTRLVGVRSHCRGAVASARCSRGPLSAEHVVPRSYPVLRAG